MELILFSADRAVGDPRNVLYPKKHVVCDSSGLAEAVSHDYVGGGF